MREGNGMDLDCINLVSIYLPDSLCIFFTYFIPVHAE